MLYFVEHGDPMLRDYYLWTDEKEPTMNDSYLCFLMEIKTLYLSEHEGQSRVFVNKKYVKKLIPIEEFPVEEKFGDIDEYKRFEYSIKKIMENI
ncbi:hypothetical protein LCGC14_1455680 [marine sediment metagenome]|uniref:Uncharacterized protein n=1 Tax=marine sediment metagenome TaxID=412755 RepID=A0A0F9JGI8_9ZZZZ